MPPRPRCEAPESQSCRIRKHVAQAQEYWAKGAQHLREEDTCQAAEKGWATVAQLGKAVATLRSWDHYDRDAVRDCLYALADEAPGQSREIIRGVRAAEHLHGHFYEVFMTLTTVELALEDVTPCLKSSGNFSLTTIQEEGHSLNQSPHSLTVNYRANKIRGAPETLVPLFMTSSHCITPQKLTE